MEPSQPAQAIRPRMKRKASLSISEERTQPTDPAQSKPSGSNNPSKQACVACRQRKVRCDAQQPCRYCVSKKQDCIYGPAFKRAQCAQAHVDALEAKVRELERPRQAHNNHDDGSVVLPSPNPETQRQKNTTTSSTENVATRVSSSPASHNTRRRYGKSTSLHFALNVKASATAMSENRENPEWASSLGDEEEEEEEEEWLMDATGQSPGMSQLLPHRHTAKSLFDKYFDSVHPIWPILPEHESRALFTTTWTSDDPPEPL
ncbi:MAG: hypothetical protein Q9219_006572 [cf. Caloplaca sp. 3 TL-2023]